MSKSFRLLSLSAVLAVCLVGPTAFVGASVRDAQKEKPCATSLGACAPEGCARNDEPLHQVFNRIKRTPPPAAGTPFVRLELGDFETLQELADDLGMPQGRGNDLTQPQRNTLKTIAVINGNTVGEGTFVQLDGFLADNDNNPRSSTGESVNCRLTRQANNDFHVIIGEDSNSTEFEGIVAEMVPQGRPAGCTLPILRQVRKAERRVLVRGLLFFDNAHAVRTDPDEAIAGNPARISVWEIHPVAVFAVCMKADNSCNPNNLNTWKKLENVTKPQLQGFIH